LEESPVPATTLSDQLLEALSHINRPGSFCTYHSVSPVLPGLEINDLGPIALPLTAAQAKEIKAHCDQAPYGKGERTLVDTKVRRVWHMMPDRFQLTNPEWQTFLTQTVQTVQEELGLQGQKLESHLYNLLLYEPGSFFLPHRDGEKLERMVATLVIVLPSSYEGGELIVRHEGQERTIDFSSVANSRFLVHFAAFYADCEHAIQPLRKGYRLCLVYNLTVAKSKKPTKAPRSSDAIARISTLLRDWAADTSETAPRKLAILLEHQYTQEGLAWDVLKGLDLARTRILREAARQADCKAYLALLTLHESGSAEYSGDNWGRGRRRYYDDYDDDDDDDTGDGSEHEMGEIYETSLTATHWTDEEGRHPQLGEMDVDDGEVVPPDGLREVEPEEEYEGYTGNAGMTLDHWYRHAAVFLWPERRHFEVLCSAGSGNAVSALQLMVSKWRTASRKNQPALKSACQEFAAQIIAKWNAYDSYRPVEKETAPRDLAALLVELDDPQLIKALFHKAMPQDAGIEFTPALAKVCDQHGWADFRDALTGVLKNTTIESLPRNVRLLEHVCLFKSKHKKEWSEACAILAPEAVAALETIDRQRDDWRAHGLNRADLLARLSRALLASQQTELFARVVDHSLATPKKYPLRPAHVDALNSLRPWLQKHVTKPCGVLSRWLTSCREQLEALTAKMPAEPADFRRDADISCKCADCKALIEFLKSPKERVGRFPVRKERRQHLHQIIERNQCDVSHVTERLGSPQTLVCTKNTASYQRKLQQYHEDKKHLVMIHSMEAKLPQ
jgi:predicted 2-oxoglutarate/Fe(II)-dependent dioxygenase YbiX